MIVMASVILALEVAVARRRALERHTREVKEETLSVGRRDTDARTFL